MRDLLKLLCAVVLLAFVCFGLARDVTARADTPQPALYVWERVAENTYVARVPAGNGAGRCMKIVSPANLATPVALACW